MSFVWNKEVTSYEVDVFESPTSDYNRSIRLDLVNGHVVRVEFPAAVPADYVDIGTSYHVVQLSANTFDTVYHILQTEKPVYFTAYTFDTSPVKFAGISTSQESVGEGLVDLSP